MCHYRQEALDESIGACIAMILLTLCIYTRNSEGIAAVTRLFTLQGML